MVYRDRKEEELFTQIASRIIVKEPIITREMVGAIQGRFSNIETSNIREVTFLLPCHPDIKGYPCIRLR